MLLFFLFLISRVTSIAVFSIIEAIENILARRGRILLLVVGVYLGDSISRVTSANYISIYFKVSSPIAWVFSSREWYRICFRLRRFSLLSHYRPRVRGNFYIADNWSIGRNSLILLTSQVDWNVSRTTFWARSIARYSLSGLWHTLVASWRYIPIIRSSTFRRSWVILSSIRWVPGATRVITAKIHRPIGSSPITTASLNLLYSSVSVFKLCLQLLESLTHFCFIFFPLLNILLKLIHLFNLVLDYLHAPNWFILKLLI